MSSRSFWEHWNFGNNSALPINQSIMQLCLEILAMANLQKNRISEFSPNSPFSSKLPFSRAPLPSHLPWKLYFGEFLPYSPYFRQIGHYRQNRYFRRRHFTVLAKFTIFVKIANLKGDHWSFLISLVPKALAKFRPVRHFRHERVFPTFLIAGVWISLYSYISA